VEEGNFAPERFEEVGRKQVYGGKIRLKGLKVVQNESE
jgi:hypothetical protein